MIPYQSKKRKTPGTNYSEVKKNVRLIFREIESKTKRKPYIKSTYFNKEKVFFDYFWKHLNQKGPKERFKRLKYFSPALDVVKNTRNKPVSKDNPNKKDKLLHRFAGLTANKELFYVQIKEEKKTGKKYFMSCFSPE